MRIPAHTDMFEWNRTKGTANNRRNQAGGLDGEKGMEGGVRGRANKHVKFANDTLSVLLPKYLQIGTE